MEQLRFLTSKYQLKGRIKGRSHWHQLCQFPLVGFIHCPSKIWCQDSELKPLCRQTSVKKTSNFLWLHFCLCKHTTRAKSHGRNKICPQEERACQNLKDLWNFQENLSPPFLFHEGPTVPGAGNEVNKAEFPTALKRVA